MTEIRTYDMQSDRYLTRYDDWRLYEGVRTRRVFAFLIDYAMIFFLVLVSIPVVFVLGFATFGAAWLLFAVLTPVVALIYIGWTVGGPSQATIGMRMTGIRLERYDGRRIDFITAIVHSVLFWASMALSAPILLVPIVLAPLFLEHKRTLHDLVLGTVAVRSDR